MHLIRDYLFVTLLAHKILLARSFSPGGYITTSKIRHINHDIRLYSTNMENNQDGDNIMSTSENDTEEDEVEQGPIKITSPLKFIGPYPSLSLHFPNLATSSQREREVSGISLDFVLDTAANTNTINAQVASELNLETAGTALPGYNAAGSMDGGTTFVLGDSSLDLPEKEIFMQGLTASALPVASPAAAGLMGVAFLNCFQGGVKFNWGSDASVTFYGDENGMEDDVAGMTKVPIEVIRDILLPSVKITVNGKVIPALLDTGSPITVFNSAAANLAGLEVIKLPQQEESEDKGGFMNPFKKVMDNVKAANSMAQAASRGDVLVIAGGEGQTVQLLKTENAVDLSMQGDENVSFPPTKIYVGDLPGLAALGGLDGINSPPAVVLGMDVLTQKPSMLYRANEVYF